jgi:hypothetical protein
VSTGLLAFSSGGSVQVKDEGTSVAAQATSLNFVGAGVTATASGGAVTVTIPGGAGGSTYTEASNYDALPTAADHGGEIYAVLAGQGVYFVNRKPAGYYYSNGSAWSFLGDLSDPYFNDGYLTFSDDADSSKKLQYQLSGISTGTTRTATWPNKDGTVAMTSDIPAFGTTAGTACEGNDARLSDTRTPTDGSVTAAKVAAALKPSGTATADTESLRALGTTASTACAGNDARLSDARTPTTHSHTISDTTGLQAALDGKQAAGSYAATTHSHAISEVTNLQSALDGKQASGSYAAATHSHAQSDVTGLASALDGKAASTHAHAVSDLTATGTPSASTYLRGDGTWATPAGGGGGDLLAANNLSDLANAATARTNLGLGTAATQASTAFAPSSHATPLNTILWGETSGVLFIDNGEAYTADGVTAAMVISGTLALARLPVATSGTSSATQVVRADDSRLSNARTPTTHSHAISDTTGLQTALDGKSATTHDHTGTYIPVGNVADIVAISQATYDGLTPVATRLYLITS